MASSSLPSRRAPATTGANWRDCLRAAWKDNRRSIITPTDHADITSKMMAMERAGHPMCSHICHKSKRGVPPPDWNNKSAAMGVLTSIELARCARSIGDDPPGSVTASVQVVGCFDTVKEHFAPEGRRQFSTNQTSGDWLFASGILTCHESNDSLTLRVSSVGLGYDRPI